MSSLESSLNWITVNSPADYPKDAYNKTHEIYLCVTAAGKTVAAKYKPNSRYTRWEASNNDSIEPVAYAKITIPPDVANLIINSKGKKVEYLDGII